jgi:membrane associated rhomboid family serine protease
MSRLILRRLSFPISFIVLIWVIHLIQVFGGLDFTTLGVYPRHVEGLTGILTSPLVHGSWEHLFYNTISFALLSGVLFGFYPRIALRSFVWLYVLSGLGVWIFAIPNSFHIGASGVVYGMVSLVFWSGIFRRNVKSIIFALIVLVVYAGFFTGIVPGKEGVSWESHLLGAVAGIFLAWWYRNDIEQDEIPPPVEEEEEQEQEKEFFLPRDVFNKKLNE